jgi:hypothetical protein
MNNLHRDNPRVAKAARECLSKLADLGDVMISQQVALALGFAEALLEELAAAADAGETAPMVGPAATRILEMRP